MTYESRGTRTGAGPGHGTGGPGSVGVYGTHHVTEMSTAVQVEDAIVLGNAAAHEMFHATMRRCKRPNRVYLTHRTLTPSHSRPSPYR
jgi:hypothetical protein